MTGYDWFTVLVPLDELDTCFSTFKNFHLSTVSLFVIPFLWTDVS